MRASAWSTEQTRRILSILQRCVLLWQTQNITALVHMSPLKLASATWAEDSYPSSQIALAAQGYFSLLQGLDAHFSTLESGVIASVTAMDGRHGNIGERFNAVQCAASGCDKILRLLNNSRCGCRALDVHPELILDPVQAAQLIHHDVFNLAGEVEVGLDRDERRWGLVAFAEDLVEDRQPLASDDTWLVSGGGSGVTASSIIAGFQNPPLIQAHILHCLDVLN